MFDLSKIFDLSKNFALPDSLLKSKSTVRQNQSFLFLLQIFGRMQAIQVEQPFMNHDKKF